MDTWLSDHYPWATRQTWPRNGWSFFSAGRQIRSMRVFMGHSTETTSWPGYGDGAAAPNATLSLLTGQLREHIPMEYGGRALAVNAHARTLNVDGVWQLEVIGAVTPGYPARYGHYDLINTFPRDERAQRFLGRVLAAVAKHSSIPLQLSEWGDWSEIYPDTYGGWRGRLSYADYRKARGILAHMHAPYPNNHGDQPGHIIGIRKALNYAKTGALDPTPDPKPDPWSRYPRGHIKWVAQALYDTGYIDTPTMGDEQLVREVVAFQRENDLDPDGLPGPNTTRKLEGIVSEVLDRLEKLEKAVRSIKSDTTSTRKWTSTMVDTVAEAVWLWKHPSGGTLNAFYHLRGGIVPSTHSKAPADRNSPGDVLRRIAHAVGVDLPHGYYDGTDVHDEPSTMDATVGGLVDEPTIDESDVTPEGK